MGAFGAIYGPKSIACSRRSKMTCCNVEIKEACIHGAHKNNVIAYAMCLEERGLSAPETPDDFLADEQVFLGLKAHGDGDILGFTRTCQGLAGNGGD